ncbi:phospholipase D-like domain-containing protein [Flavobacterium johnsoniae]|uniref:phospholipase D n=1 Tax=Flavobacterium johnsoniae TaxID=986 RepID=A0A1J7CJH0_FLAJO|nr:phospholipase D-like domain-containing protein [Flavobacterium johnsoniae]OIV41724.1 hypothetical protein BKM63_14505 [Flavobacterium johnsoniae]
MKITAYFEDHKNVIDEELKKAQKEVLVAVAWINFELYESTFDSLLERNILLKIICTDNPSNRRYMDCIENLQKKGALIKLLQMPSNNNHMHHKFAIIDGVTILNGSFNWSLNAAKSFENLMLIKDCGSESKKFLREFDAIFKIEKETIKKLQKFSKCKDCNHGELVNILVFSERSSKYFETCGDLVRTCNSCFEFTTIQDCIQDTQLYLLVDNLRGCDDEYEYDYLDDLIYKHLESYSNLDIHAVGQVLTTLDFYDEEDVATRILWRNKFVGERLPNLLEHDFEVYYDN